MRSLLAWCACLLLAATVSIATAAESPATAPAAVPAAPVDEFATFGVSLEAPAGWQRLWEGRSNMIARWSDAKPGAGATAMLTLELAPAKTRTLGDYGDELRTQFRDAKVTNDPLVIGGGPALRVLGMAPNGDIAVEALATLHGQFFYLLTAFAAGPETMPRATLEKLARSLKFREFADPAGCLTLREPQKVHPRFMLAPLVTMRPDVEIPRPGTVTLVVNDYQAQRADMVVEVQVMSNPGKLPLDKLGQTITDQITRRQPVSWGVMRSNPPRAISKPFMTPLPDGRKLHSRVGLIQLTETEAIFLNFGIDESGGAASTAAYDAACEEIAKSVQPVQK